MIQETYLENMSANDIPKKKINEVQTFKQYIPSEDDFHQQFDSNQSLKEIWNDLYVFVYENRQNNTRSLLFGPMVAKIIPSKVFGFNTNKATVETELSAVIEINNPQEIDKDHLDEVVQQFHEAIVTGNVPWVKSRQSAIITKNDLNRVINLLSKTVQEIDGDSVEIHSMNDIFDELFAVK